MAADRREKRVMRINSSSKEKCLHTANIILLVTFGLYLLYGRAAQYLPFYEHKYVILLISQILIILPGMLILRLTGQDWAGEIRFRLPEGRNVMLGLTAMVCAYPLAAVLNLISQIFVKNQVTPVVEYMLQFGLGPSIFLLALMPAFAEEFLCRGILYWYGYRGMSKKEGILVSALVFALMHLNLNQFFYAFFLGVVFALMDEAADSILVSMIMHFAINGLNVFLTYMTTMSSTAVQSQEETDVIALLAEGLQSPLQIAVSVGALAAVAGLLILIIYRAFKENGRTLRMDQAGAARQDKKHPADLFLLIYIVTAAIITVKETMFR